MRISFFVEVEVELELETELEFEVELESEIETRPSVRVILKHEELYREPSRFKNND